VPAELDTYAFARTTQVFWGTTARGQRFVTAVYATGSVLLAGIVTTGLANRLRHQRITLVASHFVWVVAPLIVLLVGCFVQFRPVFAVRGRRSAPRRALFTRYNGLDTLVFAFVMLVVSPLLIAGGPDGTPRRDRSGCAFVVVDTRSDSVLRCVNESEFKEAQRADQLLALGVMGCAVSGCLIGISRHRREMKAMAEAGWLPT
jgi:hypothetical protein